MGNTRDKIHSLRSLEKKSIPKLEEHVQKEKSEESIREVKKDAGTVIRSLETAGKNLKKHLEAAGIESGAQEQIFGRAITELKELVELVGTNLDTEGDTLEATAFTTYIKRIIKKATAITKKMIQLDDILRLSKHKEKLEKLQKDMGIKSVESESPSEGGEAQEDSDDLIDNNMAQEQNEGEKTPEVKEKIKLLLDPKENAIFDYSDQDDGWNWKKIKILKERKIDDEPAIQFEILGENEKILVSYENWNYYVDNKMIATELEDEEEAPVEPESEPKIKRKDYKEFREFRKSDDLKMKWEYFDYLLGLTKKEDGTIDISKLKAFEKIGILDEGAYLGRDRAKKRREEFIGDEEAFRAWKDKRKDVFNLINDENEEKEKKEAEENEKINKKYKAESEWITLKGGKKIIKIIGFRDDDIIYTIDGGENNSVRIEDFRKKLENNNDLAELKDISTGYFKKDPKKGSEFEIVWNEEKIQVEVVGFIFDNGENIVIKQGNRFHSPLSAEDWGKFEFVDGDVAVEGGEKQELAEAKKLLVDAISTMEGGKAPEVELLGPEEGEKTLEELFSDLHKDIDIDKVNAFATVIKTRINSGEIPGIDSENKNIVAGLDFAIIELIRGGQKYKKDLVNFIATHISTIQKSIENEIIQKKSRGEEIDEQVYLKETKEEIDKLDRLIPVTIALHEKEYLAIKVLAFSLLDEFRSNEVELNKMKNSSDGSKPVSESVDASLMDNVEKAKENTLELAKVFLEDVSIRYITPKGSIENPYSSATELQKNLLEAKFVAMGDAHGSARKILEVVIASGIVKFDSREKQHNFLKLYQEAVEAKHEFLYEGNKYIEAEKRGIDYPLEQYNKSYLELENKIVTLVKQIEDDISIIDSEKLLLLAGDTIFDRGLSDVLTIAIINKIREKNNNVKILASNHDLHYFFTNVSSNDRGSMYPDDIENILYEDYLKNTTLFHYHYDGDIPIISSHAYQTQTYIDKIKLEINFSDDINNTNIEEFVNRANNWYQKEISEMIQEIKSGKKGRDIEKKHVLLSNIVWGESYGEGGRNRDSGKINLDPSFSNVDGILYLVGHDNKVDQADSVRGISLNDYHLQMEKNEEMALSIFIADVPNLEQKKEVKKPADAPPIANVEKEKEMQEIIVDGETFSVGDKFVYKNGKEFEITRIVPSSLDASVMNIILTDTDGNEESYVTTMFILSLNTGVFNKKEGGQASVEARSEPEENKFGLNPKEGETFFIKLKGSDVYVGLVVSSIENGKVFFKDTRGDAEVIHEYSFEIWNNAVSSGDVKKEDPKIENLKKEKEISEGFKSRLDTLVTSARDVFLTGENIEKNKIGNKEEIKLLEYLYILRRISNKDDIASRFFSDGKFSLKYDDLRSDSDGFYSEIIGGQKNNIDTNLYKFEEVKEFDKREKKIKIIIEAVITGIERKIDFLKRQINELVKKVEGREAAAENPASETVELVPLLELVKDDKFTILFSDNSVWNGVYDRVDRGKIFMIVENENKEMAIERWNQLFKEGKINKVETNVISPAPESQPVVKKEIKDKEPSEEEKRINDFFLKHSSENIEDNRDEIVKYFKQLKENKLEISVEENVKSLDFAMALLDVGSVGVFELKETINLILLFEKNLLEQMKSDIYLKKEDWQREIKGKFSVTVKEHEAAFFAVLDSVVESVEEKEATAIKKKYLKDSEWIATPENEDPQNIKIKDVSDNYVILEVDGVEKTMSIGNFVGVLLETPLVAKKKAEKEKVEVINKLERLQSQIDDADTLAEFNTIIIETARENPSTALSSLIKKINKITTPFNEKKLSKENLIGLVKYLELDKGIRLKTEEKIIELIGKEYSQVVEPDVEEAPEPTIQEILSRIGTSKMIELYKSFFAETEPTVRQVKDLLNGENNVPDEFKEKWNEKYADGIFTAMQAFAQIDKQNAIMRQVSMIERQEEKNEKKSFWKTVFTKKNMLSAGLAGSVVLGTGGAGLGLGIGALGLGWGASAVASSAAAAGVWAGRMVGRNDIRKENEKDKKARERAEAEFSSEVQGSLDEFFTDSLKTQTEERMQKLMVEAVTHFNTENNGYIGFEGIDKAKKILIDAAIEAKEVADKEGATKEQTKQWQNSQLELMNTGFQDNLDSNFNIEHPRIQRILEKCGPIKQLLESAASSQLWMNDENRYKRMGGHLVAMGSAASVGYAVAGVGAAYAGASTLGAIIQRFSIRTAIRGTVGFVTKVLEQTLSYEGTKKDFDKKKKANLEALAIQYSKEEDEGKRKEIAKKFQELAELESLTKSQNLLNGVKAGAWRAGLVVAIGGAFEVARAGVGFVADTNFGGAVKDSVKGMLGMEDDPEKVFGTREEWQAYKSALSESSAESGIGNEDLQPELEEGEGLEKPPELTENQQVEAKAEKIGLKNFELKGKAMLGKGPLHLANELDDPNTKIGRFIIDTEKAAYGYKDLNDNQIIHKWRVRIAEEGGTDFANGKYSKTLYMKNAHGDDLVMKPYLKEVNGMKVVSIGPGGAEDAAEGGFYKDHEAKDIPSLKKVEVPKPSVEDMPPIKIPENTVNLLEGTEDPGYKIFVPDGGKESMDTNAYIQLANGDVTVVPLGGARGADGLVNVNTAELIKRADGLVALDSVGKESVLKDFKLQSVEGDNDIVIDEDAPPPKESKPVGALEASAEVLEAPKVLKANASYDDVKKFIDGKYENKSDQKALKNLSFFIDNVRTRVFSPETLLASKVIPDYDSALYNEYLLATQRTENAIHLALEKGQTPADIMKLDAVKKDPNSTLLNAMYSSQVDYEDASTRQRNLLITGELSNIEKIVKKDIGQS
ncbi:MAG: hypothetical protein HOE80_02785 [Candidatus Magasanikbacteria bacterium]|nr:hypothetical protein [Candidatus Magasanikbacteria bacterium]